MRRRLEAQTAARVSRKPLTWSARQMRRLIALLQRHPFDIGTAEGRSNERNRRALLSLFASGFARVIAVGVTVVSVPLTVGYLGTERFGLWVTIGSVIALLGFTDLGLGNGLINAVAQASGTGDRPAAIRYISTAFFMLLAIAVGLAVLLAVVYVQIDWPGVLNV